MKKTVFSGIQSTGNVHIGNYIGALRHWVEMQDTHDAIYCVVDLHAMTAPYDPTELARARLETAKTLLAVGIDPDRSLLFFQSQVPQHAELYWILGTISSMGALGRMTQYKEKSEKGGATFGLFAYPVLMAADILVHKAHEVPVGDDQTQHLELTRDVAQRFNQRFGEVFPIPERITPEVGARVLSLKDPLAKMSKSDPDPDAIVRIGDPPDEIVRKFRGAVTDSGKEIIYDTEEKPGIANLLEILSGFTGTPIPELTTSYNGLGYAAFKEVVAEAVIGGLAPFQKAFAALDDGEVEEVMRKGAASGRERAEPTLLEVREKVGLG
ncbi:MAG: tryptophan--tRNA ligase [Acidimicrobiia bacterium]